MKATLKQLSREHGKPRRKETGPQVMGDGLLRCSEAAALRWGDVDGSGRLNIVRSKTDQTAGKMAGLGDGFSAHSPRVGIAQDMSTTGRSCRS